MDTTGQYNVSDQEIEKLLRRVNRPGGYSRHAITDMNGNVIDHFTKPSAASRKEKGRRKEKNRRKARKANR